MELFQIWVDLIIHFFILYGVGVILFSPFRLIGYSKQDIFFFQLLLGTLGIITVFAVYYTLGKTVFVILPLLYIFGLWKWAGPSIPKTYFLKKEFLVSIALLTIILAFQLIRNAYFDQLIISYSDVDYSIYVSISEYLMQTGVEISSPWYASSDLGESLQPQPYHFGDLWLSAFCISSFTTLPPLISYIYVFIPLIGLIVFWGIFSLYHLNDIYQLKHLILPFLLIFFGINIYLSVTRGLNFNVISMPKTFFLLLLLPAAIKASIKSDYLLAGIALAIIPLGNVLFLPSIYGSIGLLITYTFLYQKTSFNNSLKLSIFPLLVLAYLVLFYSIIGDFFAGISAVKANWYDYLFRMLRGFGSGFFRVLVFVPPFSLLLYFLFRNWKDIQKQDRIVLILGIGILLGGLTGKAVFSLQESEIDQVFYLAANPAIILLLAYFLGLSDWKNKLKLLKISSYLFAVFCLITLGFVFHQRDSLSRTSFVEEVKNALDGKNKLGASISNPDLENIYTYDPRMCTYCGVLKMVGDDFWVHRLNIPHHLDILKYSEKRNAISIAPFYNFVQKQKEVGHWENLAIAKIDFINKLEIDYIILENGAPTPLYLDDCVDKVIQDPESRTTLLLLKRPCEY